MNTGIDSRLLLSCVLAAGVLATACGYRGAQVYEVPEAHVGWVEIKYGDPACGPFRSKMTGHFVVSLRPDFFASTLLADGWSPNHYYEVGSDRITIPTSGATTDRRIWRGRGQR